MKKYFIVIVIAGLQFSAYAQSLEVLDSHPNLELEIKNKFINFQQCTKRNTLLGIEKVDKKDPEKLLKDKSLSQLMYWRYDFIQPTKDSIQTSVAAIAAYKAEEIYTALGKQLVAMGIINNIIR